MSNKQLIGANLGGWLVLERWMTPSVFKGLDSKDEFGLSKTPEGRRRLLEHRRTFIGQKDIKWLAENGFDAVRIPVGYWLFTDDPPFVSGTKELDNCLKWCEKYGLKILICLHGVPGSQNGHDHSGRVGKIEVWQAKNQQKTLEILEIIAKKYAKNPAFWGLEIMNEPTLTWRNYFKVIWFYRRAYSKIRNAAGENLKIIFSDGYRPRLMNACLMFLRGSMMDIHQYHMATSYKIASRLHWRPYLRRLKRRTRLYAFLAKFQPIIIGEWSVTIGYELLQNESMRERELYQKHVDLQLETYQAAEAVFYWTYKTEGKNGWNLRYLVESGEIVLQ